MRVRVVLAVLCVLSALAMTTLATDRREQPNQNGKQAGLELFKQLAGEWEGKEISGHEPMADVHVKYAVTSAGSTVVETLFPGTAHEMVTVIHPDGDDLALTHYCAGQSAAHESRRRRRRKYGRFQVHGRLQFEIRKGPAHA